MSYVDLEDESKIALAIEFVALRQPLPKELIQFLKEKGLLSAIARPGIIEDESYDYTSGQAPENN